MRSILVEESLRGRVTEAWVRIRSQEHDSLIDRIQYATERRERETSSRARFIGQRQADLVFSTIDGKSG